MAIEYSRLSFIGRNQGKNACKKAAYNGNCKIKDLRTNHNFNFLHLKTNIYHEVLLPDNVDQRFKDIELLMNEVERSEKKKNSCLLKEYVLALPDDKEINLTERIELTKRFIERLELIKNNLAVVIDIHQPIDGETNHYAKLLVTVRRFTENGSQLGNKTRDLDMPIRRSAGKAFVPRTLRAPSHKIWKEVQNEYFEELGLLIRVNEINATLQEHIGLKKYGILAERKRKNLK
jgi:hypothetical protein